MKVFDCKKQVVTATIITPDGQRFVGKNWIRNEVALCPRAQRGCATGEGYDLCESICSQLGHAEVVALGAAGQKAEGATLYLEGHTYACNACQKACADAGITQIIVSSPPEDAA